MKHTSFYFFALLITITSCVDSNFSAGSSLFDEQVRNVVVDTTSVSLSTVLDDSTATSGISKIFMGRYESSDFGTTVAESYVSFSVPTYSASDFNKDSNVKITLDSVCLILPYDKYSYGDTTKTQTIYISQLTDKLNDLYTAHNSKFYTNHTAASESTPYLTKTFKRPLPSQDNDSTLIIRLPDEFGQVFLDSMKAQSSIFDSDAEFIKFFKGFKFSAGSDDKYCINAFKMTSSSSPRIRVFYQANDLERIDKTIDIEANTTYAFSHITQDRTNTALKDLTSYEGISSSLTSNKSYLQGLVGLSTELTFPNIRSLMQYGKYTNVDAAYLYVYPVKNSYSDFTPLPKSVKLNFVSKLGNVKEILESSTSSLTSGALNQDQFGIKYYYAFDITSFIQSEIKAADADKGTLQLNLSDTDKANSLKSFVIGDSDYPDSDYQIKLVIQLLIYNYD
jgi:Domain of unknown function (DUF4270)